MSIGYVLVTRRTPRFLPITLAALFVLATGTRPAASAPGDMAIYRENEAGDVIATAVYDHEWDTTVREDVGTYELDNERTGIRCKSGHHLVMYSARFDSINGIDRSEIQSMLRLLGSDVPIGWSQGYIRRDGSADECFTVGGGIIHVANDGDVISLRSYRTDNNAAAGVQREPDGTSIQFLKLEDTWDYCRLSRTTDQYGPAGVQYVDVAYDWQDELDTRSFGHTVGSGDITLKTPGHYLLFADTYFQSSGNNRSTYKQVLTLGGSIQMGSLTTVYLRGGTSQSCQDGATSLGIIIETSAANTVLNVECSKESGDTPQIKADRTAITIVKLPDDADYIVEFDLTGQDMNATELTAVQWSIPQEQDADSFEPPSWHDGNSKVQVKVPGDYLFLTAFGNTGLDTGQRTIPWQRWRKNGEILYAWGQSGNYNRRQNGADACGNWSGLLATLAEGDYVEVVSKSLGADGTFSGEELGLQGVSLWSLFPADTPRIGNLAGAEGVSTTSAWLQGCLVNAGSAPTEVWCYWGPTDEGTNLTWSFTNYFGQHAGEVPAAYSNNATGLTPSRTYYYRYRAVNAYGGTWANGPARFQTLGPPAVVDTESSSFLGGARLGGELTAGTSAEVTLCWGESDGGTNASAWDSTQPVGVIGLERYTVDTRPMATWAGPTHSQDVGAPALAGSTIEGRATWILRGSGEGIWGVSDSCHFSYDLVYGDFDVRCSVSDLSGGTHAWRNAGIMVRESLAGGGKNALILRTPTTGINVVSFQRRETDDAYSFSQYTSNTVGSTCWLRLARQGDTFSGYLTDSSGALANVWTQRGSSREILMSKAVYLGFAVTSHDSAQITSATFSNVDGTARHVDGGLLYGLQYYYRSYATNGYGDAWAETTTPFVTAPPAGIDLVNLPPSSITSTSATLNVELHGPGSVFDVYLYWGAADGGDDTSRWDNARYMGSWTNTGPAGVQLSHVATGLQQSASYSYRFCAVNAATNIWAAQGMSFSTLGEAPKIDNGAGAVAGTGFATLGYELLSGGSADVSVFWGSSDGGTDPRAWDHTNALFNTPQGLPFCTETARELLYGVRYYYRSYATNTVGDDWADSTVVFTTAVPMIPTEDHVQGQLAYGFYKNTDISNIAEIDDGLANGQNGGLFTLSPTPEAQWPSAVRGQAVWTNEVWQDGGIAESYCQMWHGYFHPPETGMYEFDLDADDFEILWLDVDRNGGEFEAGRDDILRNYPPEAWNTPHVTFVDLVQYQPYAIALVHREDAGGDYVNLTVTPPGGVPVRIDPDDPSQSNWWSTWSTVYRGPEIVNAAATDVSRGAATFNAALSAEGSVFDVYVHWGLSDGGMGPDATWAHTTCAGSYTNTSTAAPSYAANGLERGVVHYTFEARNALTNIWAQPALTVFTGFPDPDGSVYFSYPTFESIDGLVLNGDAAQVGNVLRLTPARGSCRGSVWYIGRPRVDKGFETRFRFRISDPSTSPADGIAFVVQNGNIAALGGGGGGLGFDGMTNGLAVEFDTYFNGEHGDPNANHISVQTNGAGENSPDHTCSLACASDITALADGNFHEAVISYAGGRLSVVFDAGKTAQPCLSVPVDLSALLGLADGTAWVGFTAATGGSWENHDILSWEFSTPREGTVIILR